MGLESSSFVYDLTGDVQFPHELEDYKFEECGMSITSDRIRGHGFIHALADDAADEIEALERENAALSNVLCKVHDLLLDGYYRESRDLLRATVAGLRGEK